MRIILNKEFKKRQKKNPKYSLRAFAKSLGTAHTVLLDLQSGKFNPTRKFAEKILTKLNFSEAEINRYLGFFQIKSKTNTSAIFDNTVEVGESESQKWEWYYGAVYSLTRTNKFNPDSKWIAQQLGITENEVKKALSELSKLDVYKQDKSGYTAKKQNIIHRSDKLTPETIRRVKLQHLDVIKDRYINSSPNQTITVSGTLPVSEAQLSQAKKMILDFYEHITNFLAMGDDQERTSVYMAGIQLVPLTKK